MGLRKTMTLSTIYQAPKRVGFLFITVTVSCVLKEDSYLPAPHSRYGIPSRKGNSVPNAVAATRAEIASSLSTS